MSEWFSEPRLSLSLAMGPELVLPLMPWLLPFSLLEVGAAGGPRRAFLKAGALRMASLSLCSIAAMAKGVGEGGFGWRSPMAPRGLGLRGGGGRRDEAWRARDWWRDGGGDETSELTIVGKSMVYGMLVSGGDGVL